MGRKIRDRRVLITRRFMEKIGDELLQSSMYAARNNYDGAQRCYEEAVQMIDTFLEETGLQKYMDEQAKRRENAEEQLPPSAVSAESKHAEEDQGAAKKAKTGARKRKSTSAGARNSDKG